MPDAQLVRYLSIQDTIMNSQLNKAAPEGYNTLNAYITVKDVPALIGFLQRTFGGIVKEQIEQPDGQIEHAEVKVGNSLLILGPPKVDGLMRGHEKNLPATFYAFVPDVDSTYAKAMACGAHAWTLPRETFYGDRVAAVTDTNGNAWWIATRKEALDTAELQTRADLHWHKRSSAPDTTQRAPDAGVASPPAGYQVINPYVSVGDTSGFIAFIERTFDGTLIRQIRQPDGQTEHAEIRIGDSVLMVGPPEVEALAQAEDHHRAASFYVFVSDVDATFDKAISCGAVLVEAPSERFFGDRVAGVKDPYGNHWWIAARKQTMEAKELQERADEHWDVRSRAVGQRVSKTEVLDFLRSHRYAVQATVTEQGLPQAALVAFVVTDELELFFDTFASTRKAKNLARSPHLALVIGGQAGDQRTVQYEGGVDSPTGEELENLKNAYFAVHPDGLHRSRLPGIRYFRVRPRWIRYTNFNAAPAQIVAFEGGALESHSSSRATGASSSHYTQPKSTWQPRVELEPDFNAFVSPAPPDQAPRLAVLDGG